MMGSLVPDLIFGKIPPLLCLAIAMAINGVAQEGLNANLMNNP